MVHLWDGLLRDDWLGEQTYLSLSHILGLISDKNTLGGAPLA